MLQVLSVERYRLSDQEGCALPLPAFWTIHDTSTICCVAADAGAMNAVGARSGVLMEIVAARSLLASFAS